MKRFYLNYTSIFVIFAAVMALYVFRGNYFAVEPQYAGTIIDPHTYMTPGQINSAQTLARIGSLSFFLMPFIQIGVLIALFVFSSRLRNRVESWFSGSFWRLPVYWFLFFLLTEALMLPLNYALLRIDRHYGVSNESTALWLTDQLKSFGIGWLSGWIMLAVMLWLVRKSPRRAWLSIWLISIPFTLFLTFIQPVVLDPLFNDYVPLQDEALKKDILELAARAGVPADQVYQVNMSERTNALNAYVSGIGSNARIVLWDTTLRALQKDEILTVMAHEIGHYAEKHIYWGIAFGLVISLGVIWGSFHLYRYGIRQWGPKFGFRGMSDFAALPLLLVIVTGAGFVTTPIQNAFSRILEHRADVYAMNMTNDGDAAIRGFQKIAKESLAAVTQPKLVYWFLGSHPTIVERMAFFRQYQRR